MPAVSGPTDGAGAVPADQAPLRARFRPVRSRQVAIGVGVVQALVLVVLALVLPYEGPGAFQWYDRVGIVGFAAAIGYMMSRYATLSAVPDADGLTVRNLLLTRRLAWAEVVAVRFAGGDPWVTLDLSDGDTVAVMAIQRADGETARHEATRLATLVALHSRTPRDD